MWSNHSQAILASLVWLAGSSALYFGGERWLQNPRSLSGLRLNVWHLFLVALLVRLVPALFLPFGAEYDINSYHLVADAVWQREDVYTSDAVAGRYPYLPLMLYWFAAAAWLSEHLILPFVVWVKLPAILADCGITVLLYQVVRANRSEYAPSQAVLIALLYACNPLSLLVSAYHGQFDAIAVWSLLWAWWEWEQRREGWSAAAFGLAILSKTWPALLLPALLAELPHWRTRLRYLVAAAILPLSFVALYLWLFDGSARAIFLGRPFNHKGVLGYWSISGLLTLGQWAWPSLAPLNQWYLSLGRSLMLMGALLAYWHSRQQTIPQRILVILLMVFALTPGIGIQWLLWVVPFGLMVRDAKARQIYMAGSLVYVGLNLYGLHFSNWLPQITPADWLRPVLIVTTWPAWLAVIVWMITRWLRPRSNSLAPTLLADLPQRDTA